MPGAGVLHATADVIDHAVGEADDVEVMTMVAGRRCMPTAWRSRGGVERDHPNPGEPLWRAAAQPADHGLGGAVLHDVEQPTIGGIDQRRHVEGVMVAGGTQPRRLVHRQRGDAVEAGGSPTSGLPCRAPRPSR